MRLDFRFQHSGFRFRFDGFPFAERAAFGRHAQLCPGAATALPASAGGVQRGGVPLWAGAAGGFALGEDFGRGGLEAGAGEAARRLHGADRLISPSADVLGDSGEYVRREERGGDHEKVTVAEPLTALPNES